MNWHAVLLRLYSGEEPTSQCRGRKRCGFDPGVGSGSPLQDSCLKNPMDRGAWWATVRGVAKSQTQLRSWEQQIANTMIPFYHSYEYEKGAFFLLLAQMYSNTIGMFRVKGGKILHGLKRSKNDRTVINLNDYLNHCFFLRQQRGKRTVTSG